jgi:hypothetical protein
MHKKILPITASLALFLNISRGGILRAAKATAQP